MVHVAAGRNLRFDLKGAGLRVLSTTDAVAVAFGNHGFDCARQTPLSFQAGEGLVRRQLFLWGLRFIT